MTLKEKLEVQKKKTYDFLVNPKVVRLCIKGALILFIPSLIIGAIIASLLDPAGIWMASAIWNQVGMAELPALALLLDRRPRGFYLGGSEEALFGEADDYWSAAGAGKSGWRKAVRKKGPFFGPDGVWAASVTVCR